MLFNLVSVILVITLQSSKLLFSTEMMLICISIKFLSNYIYMLTSHNFTVISEKATIWRKI